MRITFFWKDVIHSNIAARISKLPIKTIYLEDWSTKCCYWITIRRTQLLTMTDDHQSKHVGESKIICTIGICFAVGYIAGWAWQNTHGLPLSYHCGAGVTLIVHFCHKVFAINMDTYNFICTTEEQRAVIHFCGLKVYQVLKCIEWCQCSMVTLSCHNGLSVNP